MNIVYITEAEARRLIKRQLKRTLFNRLKRFFFRKKEKIYLITLDGNSAGKSGDVFYIASA